MAPPLTDQSGILGLGVGLPATELDNAYWTDRLGISDEWIVSRTGIRTRRIAQAAETTVELSLIAAQRALVDANLDPGDIDEIIVATDTPEVGFPDTASFVQHRLGARHVPSYDLAGSGCAGFVLGLDIAATRAGSTRNVLLIGVDLISRVMDWGDPNVAILFGDAAGAVVIGPAVGGSPVSRLLAMRSGTDGSLSDILIREVGGTRTPISPALVDSGAYRTVAMDGPRVFFHAVKRMAEAGETVLGDAGVELGDVALVIPHQANMRIVEGLRKKLDIEPQRVFANVDRVGNTGSASVPVALADARSQGLLTNGDLVLLVAFGSGLHWSAALVEWADPGGDSGSYVDPSVQ